MAVAWKKELQLQGKKVQRLENVIEKLLLPLQTKVLLIKLRREAMVEIKKDILTTLSYFDLFNYPLTGDEIYKFLPFQYDHSEFRYMLQLMVTDTLIFEFDQYYTLKNDYSLIPRREKGAEKADEMMMAARKAGNFLMKFPYVRGIGISGSLSKNFANDDADVDFFIITAKNRLWIARSLMHLFKKIVMAIGKERYFCMNYYIDEHDLVIHEKNIYTAVEIVTLIPLHSHAIFEQFYAANTWAKDYLPNKLPQPAPLQPARSSLLKKSIEFLFNNRLGDNLDDWLMTSTRKRWQKKMRMKEQGKQVAIKPMDTGKHYSKSDPNGFQQKLMTNYWNRVSQVLEQYEAGLMQG